MHNLFRSSDRAQSLYGGVPHRRFLGAHTRMAVTFGFVLSWSSVSGFAPALHGAGLRSPGVNRLPFRNGATGTWAANVNHASRKWSMVDMSQAISIATQNAAILSEESYKYFISGGMAASISHGVTVPIDVVKTRLQTDDNLKSTGFVRATSTIVKEEGVLSLSKGLGSTVIGYAIQGSLKYGLYEIFKAALTAAAVTDNKLYTFIMAAAVSELIASTALCPLEATRIRLVSEPTYGQEVFDALPRLVGEKGLGIFGGLPAIWCKQVPYTVTQLAVFDLLTGQGAALLRAAALDGDPSARFAVTFFSAVVAAVLSSLASQPGDTVLSEVNKGQSKYGTSVTDIVTGMAAAAPADFFRGTRARLVHMLAIVVSQLVMYDSIKLLLGIPAAAGH